MKKLLFLVLCLFSLILSGCALTTETVDIPYISNAVVSRIQDANQITINVQTQDIRLDKSKVSSKKNGYGMELAPILSNEKVDVIFKRAIETELTNRGFQLSPQSMVQINADISRFYNDHKTGFFAGDAVADLDMIVIVKSATGNQLYHRQIATQGIEANTQLMTGENASLALRKALKNGIDTLFNDNTFITALLSSKNQSKGVANTFVNSPSPQEFEKTIPKIASDEELALTNYFDKIPESWPQKIYYETDGYRYWSIPSEVLTDQNEAVLSSKNKADVILSKEFPDKPLSSINYETTHMEMVKYNGKYRSWRLVRVPRVQK